jgi:hypothetical protein
MADLQIRGAEKFGEVAKALKQAGDKELRKELYSSLNRAAKPMVADAKKSAAAKLPKSGGLNKRVAKARMSIRRRAGSRPSVKIVASGMSQLGLINRGRVRHLVYGRAPMVDQAIPEAKDWFTEPMQARAGEVRREIVKAIDTVARKLSR